MKIGIDAKWYFDGPPSGRVVVRNLVDEMIKRENVSVELFLFIDKKFHKEALSIFPANVKILPILAQPNLLSNVFLVPYFASKHKLDVVLFQNFSSFWGNFKKVVYIHDFLFLDYPEFYSNRELLYFKPMQILAKRADLLITISNSEKARMIKYGIGTDLNISVVYHGISEKFKSLSDFSDTEILIFNKKFNLPKDYLLFVGRINIRKNLLNLIKAMSLLKNKSIKLIIVGKPDHKNDDLTDVLKLNSLLDRIIFTGFVDEQDLYLFFAKAKLFCFPSFAEGFGLPPLEAMQSGIPAIVSNTTCLPEICGDAAIYINPNSPNDIAEKIDLYIDNEEMYANKQCISVLHSRKFSWNKAAGEIIEILKSKQ